MNENEYYEALSRQGMRTGCMLSVLAGAMVFLLLCLAKTMEK